MIQVSSELKNAVITEQKPKNMSVTITNTANLKVLNWYTEEITGDVVYELDIPPLTAWYYRNWFKFRVDGAIDYDYKSQATRLGVSFDLKFEDITTGDTFRPRLGWLDNQGNYVEVGYGPFAVSNYTDYTRFSMSCEPLNLERLDYVSFYNGSSTENITCKMRLRNPRVYMYIENDWQGVDDYTDIMATDENISKYIAIGTFTNADIISESFAYRESVCSTDNFKLGLCETSSVEISLFNTPQIPNGADIDISMHIGDIEDGFEWNNYKIAEVKKTQKGDYSIRNIVAYDRSSALSDNMYDWLTKYLWGMNLDSPAPAVQHKFDYARQIYATVYSALRKKQVEKQNIYDPNHYASAVINPDDYKTQDRYFNYCTSTYPRIIFCKYTITKRSDCDCAYAIQTGQQFRYPSGGNLFDWDKYRRGIFYNACIYADLNLDNGEVVRVLADSSEPIAVPSNCTTIDFYVPYAIGDNNFNIYRYGQSQNGIFVSQVQFTQRKQSWYNTDDIKNGYRELPYYRYSRTSKPTKDDIIKVDSSVTLRDIARSICEMCGCFFRLDRNGNAKYLYPSQHGMYPENTLYPADDLFPQKSAEMTMPTSYYISALYEDEQIKSFGGIQVVSKETSNTGTAVRWEYWVGADSDNAYIIDDNIFLSAEEMEYVSTVDDIPTILETMFETLGNAQYTPFEAETIGTPFLESGDRFTLLTKNDGFESFILERTLKGIQALKDYFSARGINKTEKITLYEQNEEQ